MMVMKMLKFKKSKNTKKIIFIERKGSGWGGFIGSYIIDLENKAITIFEKPITIAEMIDYVATKRYLLTSVSFNEDLSLLWQMGWNCNKEKLPVVMDNQLDTITLYDGRKKEIIYDTYLKFIKPSNAALDGKISSLLDYLVRNY